MATCYRHPSRETGVSCSNCGRPICPDCMTTTAVGMRCPECSKQSTKAVRLRERSNTPSVAYVLIALNVIAFFAEQGQFSLFGTGIHGTVINEGVLDRFNIDVQHEYWRLVSSAFLHVNLLHIGFNMYLLYVLGQMLEPAMGRLRFGLIYLTSLLAGSFGTLLVTSAPSLGASGAVFGLMGAAVVELRARRLSVMESGIGGLLILNLIISFTWSHISVGAHIGGLIGGALAALALRAADERRTRALGLVGCLVLCVCAVAGAIAAAHASGTGVA